MPAIRNAQTQESHPMRKSEACKSKFFRAADYPADWEQVYEVETARLEKFDGGKEKLVIFFRREQSGLVCGPVLWDEVIAARGEEDWDDWAGYRVQLYRTTTLYAGKTVPAIRVREAPPEPIKKAKKVAPQPVEEEAEV